MANVRRITEKRIEILGETENKYENQKLKLNRKSIDQNRHAEKDCGQYQKVK